MAMSDDRELLKSRPSGWHRPMWWANGLAVLVLLATYLAPHVSPKLFWPLVLLAYAYPFQVALHGIFLLYWLIARPKRMLLSGIALLIGGSHIGDHFQLRGSAAPPEGVEAEGTKLISWNVRLFDLYNWDSNDRTRDAIFDVLRREDAGILCLQEFFHSSDKRYFRTRDALVGELGYRAEHMAWSQKARNDQHFGIATFSRHPIVRRGQVAFAERSGNLCIWTDVAVEGDTVRVYNAHLASFHFGDQDYRFLDSLNTGTDTETIKVRGGRILGLLRSGSVRRAEEVAAIVEDMARSPHPVVFCGDINDVPMSYAYGQLRGNRRDAFVESGSGTGGTYIGKLPRLRIDHILHDEAIASWGFEVLPEELSDHRANRVMIAVR